MSALGPLDLSAGGGTGSKRSSYSSLHSMPPTTSYPLATSTSLLRRCSSSIGDEDRDKDSQDGFQSDDEPFRPRAPSIISVSSLERRRHQPRINIFDNSNRVETTFARDARIHGRHIVGGHASGYVVYDCEITTVNGTRIRTLKRYSAFVRLRDELYTNFPRFALSLPEFPSKSGLSKFRPSFLDKRQRKLDLWLRSVLLHPSVLSTCNSTKQWVLE